MPALGDENGQIRLCDLAEAPSLRISVIVRTHHGIEGVVRWAHPTEVADPRPHLRDRELVCTVGSALLDAASVEVFADAVRSAGAAGICFGVGDVHTRVPPTLVGACKCLGVPLLSMAHGVPFTAINDYLAESRMAGLTERTARDGRLMSSLLSELRRGGATEQLLSIASAAVGGRLDLSGGAAGGRSERPGVTSLSVPTGSGQTLTWSGSAPAPDRETLNQVARVLEVASLELDRERTWERDRVGRLCELIGDGLAGGAALLPEIEASGLAAELLTVSAWPSGAARILVERLPDGLVASTPSAALLVSASPMEVRELAHDLALICGYSSQVSVDDLGRGITEARTALTLARRQGEVVGPERFTTFPALLAQQPLARLAAFVDELIRPLLDNDGRHRGNLVVTLRSFIAHEASIQATADATYLHVNTVRHRLGRIRALVGRNPLVYSDLVALNVALAAYDRGQRRTGRVGTPS